MSRSRPPLLGALVVTLTLAGCTWNSLYLDRASIRTIQPALPVFVNTDLATKLTLSGGAEYRQQSSFGLDGPNPAGPDRNISLRLPEAAWSAGVDQYFLRYLVAGFSLAQDAGNGRFGSSSFRFGFRTKADNAYLQLNVFYSRQRIEEESRWSLVRTTSELFSRTDTRDTFQLVSSGSRQASQFGIQATMNAGREFLRCLPGLCVYTDLGNLAYRDTVDRSLAVNLVQFGIRPALSVRLVKGLYLNGYFDNDWYFAIKGAVNNRLYYHWRTGIGLSAEVKGL